MKEVTLKDGECAIILSDKEVSFVSGDYLETDSLPTHVVSSYTIFYLLSSSCDEFQNFVYSRSVEAFKSVGLELEVKFDGGLQ